MISYQFRLFHVMIRSVKAFLNPIAQSLISKSYSFLDLLIGPISWHTYVLSKLNIATLCKQSSSLGWLEHII